MRRMLTLTALLALYAVMPWRNGRGSTVRRCAAPSVSRLQRAADPPSAGESAEQKHALPLIRG